MKPETPRPLSEAADAYYGWLVQRLMQTANEWKPVDGTLVATLAEMLETQEHLAAQLNRQPLNSQLLKLRLAVSAQIATYSRMLGLCPKHRQPPQQTTDQQSILQIAADLGLDPDLIRQLTPTA